MDLQDALIPKIWVSPGKVSIGVRVVRHIYAGFGEMGNGVFCEGKAFISEYQRCIYMVDQGIQLGKIGIHTLCVIFQVLRALQR